MKYAVRKNFIAHSSNIKARLAFKTKETAWLEAQGPVVINISIHSAFNRDVAGDLKMNALIRTVKNHVRGRVTLLLADAAHAKSNGLVKCVRDAQTLHERFKGYFEGCAVEYWHSYICQDESYLSAVNQIKELYRQDPLFRDYFLRDGGEFDDLVEQCACQLVLSKKGYRFQFYPGESYASTEYVNQLLLPQERRVEWIKVFLAIEKKTLSS